MTTFTNKSKNITTFTNKSKNTTSWTNKSISLSAGLWGSSVLPWQLALPWQEPASGLLTTWTNKSKN